MKSLLEIYNSLSNFDRNVITTLLNISSKYCNNDSELGIQCHEGIQTIKNKLSEYGDKENWKRHLKFIEWDELKWKDIGELLLKDNKKFNNEVIDNMIEDISDGSMNGHSFIKYKNYYIDPYLWSMGVELEEINVVDSYLESIYKKV